MTNLVKVNVLAMFLKENQWKIFHMHASVVGSLMYAQVCTRPDIAFIVGVLGRYLSNPRQAHWVAAKKVMRYLQRTKDYMLVYRKMENLEVLGYTDSDFAGCSDDLKSTLGYIFMMTRKLFLGRVSNKLFVLLLLCKLSLLLVIVTTRTK